MSGAWAQLWRTQTFHVPAEGEATYDPRDVRWHQYVVRLGKLFGACAGLPLMAVAAWLYLDFLLTAPNLVGALVGPVLVAGIYPGFRLFGCGAGLLVAPGRFLRGPIGRRWLTIVGVRSPLAARLVCLLLLGAFAAVLVSLARARL